MKNIIAKIALCAVLAGSLSGCFYHRGWYGHPGYDHGGYGHPGPGPGPAYGHGPGPGPGVDHPGF